MNLTITENATAKIIEVIQEEGNPELKLRMYVQGGGCSGMSYGFTLDEVQNEDDWVIPAGSATILVDSMSMQYITGAEVDFKDDLSGSQFVINNPNAQTTCGCGSSFQPDYDMMEHY
jgi:iron-sulfur cluster insertion protein